MITGNCEVSPCQRRKMEVDGRHARFFDRKAEAFRIGTFPTVHRPGSAFLSAENRVQKFPQRHFSVSAHTSRHVPRNSPLYNDAKAHARQTRETSSRQQTEMIHRISRGRYMRDKNNPLQTTEPSGQSMERE
jgi:hypothetical protein